MSRSIARCPAPQPQQRRTRWRLTALTLLGAASLAACNGESVPPPPPAPTLAAHEVEQPAGWDADLKLAEAVDVNPDPDVVEIALEAKIADVEILPGIKTRAWTYNGKIPGPLIRAKVGDRIIVNFKNSLPQSTTIHWHGLRVPNDMDGAPGITQEPIAAGAQFRYEFTARDAGTYWYHPHIDSSAQVGNGLYGAIIVEDPKDQRDFGDELVLVLSDMSLGEDGQLLDADGGGEFGDLFGREGTVVLVNGKVRPTLKVREGKQQRWRIVNAARARYFNLRLRNHRFMRLGGDNGLAARSSDVYNLVVTPGERADAVFTPADPPGTDNLMRWVAVDRGFGSTFNRPSEDMLQIVTVNEPAVRPEPIPEQLRDIEPIDIAGAKERRLELTIGRQDQHLTMGINGRPYWKSLPLEIEVGDTEVWDVVNDTDFAHPFHLHGFFFQVLDDTRVPEWKDTVNVPSKSQLKLAIKFDERPGVWMYHCHILDHAEVGMMGHLRLRERGTPIPAESPAHEHHAGHSMAPSGERPTRDLPTGG